MANDKPDAFWTASEARVSDDSADLTPPAGWAPAHFPYAAPANTADIRRVVRDELREANECRDDSHANAWALMMGYLRDDLQDTIAKIRVGVRRNAEAEED